MGAVEGVVDEGAVETLAAEREASPPPPPIVAIIGAEEGTGLGEGPVFVVAMPTAAPADEVVEAAAEVPYLSVAVVPVAVEPPVVDAVVVDDDNDDDDDDDDNDDDDPVEEDEEAAADLVTMVGCAPPALIIPPDVDPAALY